MTCRDYPTLLGRLPVFLPVKTRLREISYQCDWGTVRADSSLTTFDEDVFIALYNMAQTETNEDVPHFKVRFRTVYEICKKMRKDYGTKAKEEIVKSVNKLGTTKLIITTPYENKPYEFEGSILACLEKEENEIVIVFNNKIGMIDKTSTIDLDIRNQLSPFGKALFRFISCHNCNKGFYLETLKKAVAPHQRNDNFKIQLEKELDRLKEKKAVKEWKLSKKEAGYKIEIAKNKVSKVAG
jgi:hypothetical protein